MLCPAGAIAAAKLAQSRAVGARVLEVRGSFDQAMESCLELAGSGSFVLVNSLNPNRIEGQKTAAFEIASSSARAPDVLALPYGGGGNTVAYAKGWAEEGVRPRIVSAHAVERAVTIASAIRIAEPVHLRRGRGARRRGPRRAGHRLRRGTRRERGATSRRTKGSSASLPRPRAWPALAQVELEPGSTVVCVLTGHGLKDTAAVERITTECDPGRPDRRVDPGRGDAVSG